MPQIDVPFHHQLTRYSVCGGEMRPDEKYGDYVRYEEVKKVINTLEKARILCGQAAVVMHSQFLIPQFSLEEMEVVEAMIKTMLYLNEGKFFEE